MSLLNKLSITWSTFGKYFVHVLFFVLSNTARASFVHDYFSSPFSSKNVIKDNYM